MKHIFTALISVLILTSVAIAAEKPRVLVASYDGAIGPASAEWLSSAIRTAHRENVQAVIIELDTPGGLLESTRLLVMDMVASSVPVVLYVTPSGARAASAGAFISMAAHVSAMAPGTRIGAAHPVEMGQESKGDMRAKMENDAAAFIRTLAEGSGRNAQWAEDAVRKSSSATEKEALALRVVELVVKDRAALLDALDGRKVKTAAGVVTLRTKGADVRVYPMNWRVKALKTITDPNVAYILMMVGIYGILYEIIHPGAIFPGVAGGISLILGLYALQTLPVNTAGIALLFLAVLFFVIETQVVSGLLGLGGILSLIFGSLLLIHGDFPEWQVSRALIAGVSLTTAIFLGGALWLIAQIRKAKPVTGAESMAGRTALAKTALNPEGQVLVNGEIWTARADQPVAVGETVEVISVDNLKLKVRKQG